MSVDTQEDLALFITMNFFFDDIDVLEFKIVYKDLKNSSRADYNPYDFKIWDRFEDLSLQEILHNIDYQYKSTLAILETYK